MAQIEATDRTVTVFYLKAIHVSLAVIWVAGLPVLLLGKNARGMSEILFRWDRYIMIPAMVTTLASGMWCARLGEWFSNGQFWLAAKLMVVVILIASHGFQSGSLLRASTQINTAQEFSLTYCWLWIVAISFVIFLAEMKPF